MDETTQPSITSVDELARDLPSRADTGEPREAPAGSRRLAYLSLADRQAAGAAALEQVPIAQLAQFTTPEGRADPVDLLVGQETSRVRELLPVRHARMASSAFAFYRGTALLMATDLAPLPRTSLEVQLCGDAHLSNFGLFAAPDRTVVFDVNDFDETHPGPFEWDVKRLATSFVLAARDNALSEKAGRAAAKAACASYRLSMASFADKAELDVWYERGDSRSLDAQVKALAADTKSKPLNRARRLSAAEAEKAVAKARARDGWSAIRKITEVVDGQRRFRDQRPLLARVEGGSELSALIDTVFEDYCATVQEDRRELLGRYRIIDFGHKVVGVGSVGLLAFVLLLAGRDDQDLLVLQVKQAQASVLEAFTRPSAFGQHGHRVVAGQRLMQPASDAFLGWVDGPGGRSFYVRQLRDMKWAPDPASFDAERLVRYAVLCGHTLARTHARSGDAVAIATYLGWERSFDKAVTAFATAYADRMQEDYRGFAAAIADGRIEAREGAAGDEGITGAKRIAEHY